MAFEWNYKFRRYSGCKKRYGYIGDSFYTVKTIDSNNLLLLKLNLKIIRETFETYISYSRMVSYTCFNILLALNILWELIVR